MQYEERMIHGKNGREHFAVYWTPDSTISALLIMTHGHGEHIRRYKHVGEALADRGIQCLGYDLRGHGESPGKRGYIENWSDYRDDLAAISNEAKLNAPDVPVFLYGHSLGGNICLDYALRAPEAFQGVIASAPAIGKPAIPEYLFLIARLLSQIIPQFTMATQLDPNTLSRNQDVVTAYIGDPLVHNRGTARLGTELTRISEWIQANAEHWSVPLLLLHGEKDRLMDPADSRRFFENVRIEDKTYLELKDGFHEPHNDVDKEFVIQRIGDWIEAHLS
jgi:alpha-beta hydrolase superfamily lysophospholipase